MARNCLTFILDFILMQMSKVSREKGHRHMAEEKAKRKVIICHNDVRVDWYVSGDNSSLT